MKRASAAVEIFGQLKFIIFKRLALIILNVLKQTIDNLIPLFQISEQKIYSASSVV
jgi:hypothetical protein